MRNSRFVLLRRRVLRYVNAHVRTQRTPSKYRWTGKALVLAYPEHWAIEVQEDNDLAWSKNLVHDVDHYRIAAPSRRKKPEFGLGSAPYTPGHYSGPPKPKSLASVWEELETTLLDLVIMLKLKFPQPDIQDWFSEVGRIDLNPRSCGEIYETKITPLLTAKEKKFVPVALEVVEKFLRLHQQRQRRHEDDSGNHQRDPVHT